VASLNNNLDQRYEISFILHYTALRYSNTVAY
jgi:hypothetical protein